ncbi:MAG: MAPEG family protein [Gammaproteobacteria bacterium]|nr:MAPEG family protein [Gammaproteobacteria bacterium]
MITTVYAALGALMIVWLSLQVIKLRYREKVNIGDGGCEQLTAAIAAQLNAVEYIPIALILLFTLEYNGAHAALVHAFGIALLAGRALHARAMLANDLGLRVRGMQITLWGITGLAIVNLLYLAWAGLSAF